jgi:hypothetical protein
MTDYPVYITTNAQAERAVAMSAAKKAAIRHIDRVAAEKRGEVKQVRKLDGLGLLHKHGEITDDMHRVGLAYQRAYEACAGLRGRNPLNDQPPGDKDAAMQLTIDAGRLVERYEVFCTTKGELAALRAIVGLGESVREFAGGGRAHREVTDRIVGLLARMVEARL